MSVDIHVDTEHDAVVVSLVGKADAHLLAPLQDALRVAMADAALLVVDVDGLTAVEPDSFVQLVAALAGVHGHARLAAGRWRAGLPPAINGDGMAGVIPVSGSVEEALAAGRPPA